MEEESAGRLMAGVGSTAHSRGGNRKDAGEPIGKTGRRDRGTKNERIGGATRRAEDRSFRGCDHFNPTIEINNHDAASDLIGNLREKLAPCYVVGVAEFMPFAARAIELRYARLPLEFLIACSFTNNSATERHDVATWHLCHTTKTFALASHGVSVGACAL